MASESDGLAPAAEQVLGNDKQGSSDNTPSDPPHNEDEEDEESDNDEEQDGSEEEDEDDDDDDEPMLKYASLTKGQGPIYRNGDAISASLVAGDKMIVGTHNGYIHVLALPSFQSLRAYNAHKASVSSISISPFPPPLPSAKSEAVSRVAAEKPELSSRASSLSTATTATRAGTSQKGTRQPSSVPNTPSNAIHVATSSIDGNVCVFSLTDSKDALMRNFSRPVHSVALSPDYKNDRSYISGGTAGNLVLTTGGKSGTSATANTSGAAAAAAGWLNTIGIGGNNGTDQVLHHGEGIISTIKWSLSGRYVVWANEKGIKIMRSNLHLESHESEFAWKRLGHIDRPARKNWDDMAGVWKARADWIDEDGLERLDEANEPGPAKGSNSQKQPDSQKQSNSSSQVMSKSDKPRKERLVVGWGDTIWIIDVHPGGTGVGRDAGERKIGQVEIVKILRTDCIVSGVSLYTPNLLLLLAYVTPEPDQHKKNVETTPRRGISKRQNAIQPEMRIIDFMTEEEVSVADTLNVSRFESLSAADYHLGVLPVMRGQGKLESSRGALEMIGGVGATIWDATLYPARLFSSAASVKSMGSAGDKPSGSQASTSDSASIAFKSGQGPHPALLTRGMKIFIQSPYDCVLATRPTPNDHLVWLDEHQRYDEAWNLLESHPDSAGVLSGEGSGTSTPTTAQNSHLQHLQAQTSLVEFFADDGSQTTDSKERTKHSQASKEKRRVGEKWLHQLIKQDKWTTAAEACGRVLDNSKSWEHWVWIFAEAEKFDEITPHIPDEHMRPPISPTVYEVVLGHYISTDRPRLSELLERWSPELFDVGAIISALESRLKEGDIHQNSVEDGKTGRDWRILTNSLATLYDANGRYRDALKCYIKLQDADAAMALLSTHHLVEAVADDVPGLILLRVSKEQQKSAPIEELDEASTEPIRLLVAEAHQGVVRPETVLKQLNAQKGMKAFEYFYLRDLWNGETMETSSKPTPRRNRFDVVTNPLAVEGRSLVNDSADVALDIFAEYDRDLLFEFLKTSPSYNLSTATSICEKKTYLPELVYLLAKEGQMKRALRTIIDKMGDVSQAISFAKEQDDAELWNDLLNYSMGKPKFIKALLEEVGTAIDPIKLVRRIPEGLEIPGLRDALTRMIKEYELQDSISEGVVRVLRGEVARGMSSLRHGQKKAVRFDIVLNGEHPQNKDGKYERQVTRKDRHEKIKSGHCSGCDEVLLEGEKDPLISFPCMHAFHLSCYLSYNTTPVQSPKAETTQTGLESDPTKLTTFPKVEDPMEGTDPDDFTGGIDYGIGPKVRFSKDLRRPDKVEPGTGCPLDIHQLVEVDS